MTGRIEFISILFLFKWFMIISRDTEEIEFDKNSAVTVGTFDGVHIGHQQIFDELKKIKQQTGCRTIVVTFDPHPQIVLKNKHHDHNKPIRLLSTTEEKLELFKKAGIDIARIISFTEKFADTPAKDFFENYIIKKTGITDLVIGYDHHFGKNREGSIETIKELSAENGFKVHKVDEYTLGSEIVSSTLIRNFLCSGEIQKANVLLGKYYSLTGKVVEGFKRGKELGYPTANIEVQSEYKLIPASGIYAVRCTVNGKMYFGMMSIGFNPTFNDVKKQTLEVNIFDFDNNIYGEEIKIEFLEYIRGELKFDSTESLKQKINSDKEKTLSIINKLHVN